MERSLVLLKPDAVQRGLVGEIISRLERRGLTLVGAKLMSVSDDLARRHYAEHVGKPFFDGLVSFITSSPIMAMVIQGQNAVEVVRATIGETDPRKSPPGTIRGDLALSIGMNLIHGSDSNESAKREMELFFSDGELLDYEKDGDRWTTEA
jgi:nucleoside-diphosphate kinase